MGDMPDGAMRVFGERADLARRYAELLASDGVVRGLIGPREVPRLWERHLLNSAVLTELIAPRTDVLDVGSGAGLPGIPLAIVRTDLMVTLVEPMLRRWRFLTEVVADLELDNVEILRARAEEVRPRGKADVAVSRALAPLDRLTQWCLPLVRPGGEMLAIKGAKAGEEIEVHHLAVQRAGGVAVEVLSCGADVLETPATVIRVVRAR